MSTKPWEQEWHRGSGEGGENLFAVYTDAGEVVGTRQHPDFLAAAPDMARALMALLEQDPGSDLRFMIPGVLRDAREALRKAGVL